ncbi:MAG: hypothetical protein GX442_25705 [Candidatus Riflebacteria bacterium]|nr:hypothetical protein [Candidatus Riflebacteria bacterium]
MTPGAGPSRGVALVVVLVLSLCLMLFIIGFQTYSQSEFRHLERVMTQTTLDYLVQAGLNIAEDRLQKERWYGDQHTRGKLEIPDPPIPRSPNHASSSTPTIMPTPSGGPSGNTSITCSTTSRSSSRPPTVG